MICEKTTVKTYQKQFCIHMNSYAYIATLCIPNWHVWDVLKMVCIQIRSQVFQTSITSKLLSNKANKQNKKCRYYNNHDCNTKWIHSSFSEFAPSIKYSVMALVDAVVYLE